ncbi:MAG: KH domain-containing protein [Patescibacteria group bacterium]|jgi:predicted RNA-binding protein YlqC (UPF0109 family)
MKETLEYILKSILKDSSDQISVDDREEKGVTILEVSAPSDVIGQIIGKEGRVIKAIRTILTVSYPNQRFNLEIKD